MTDVTYGVYFNSGQNNRTNTYTTNSNITKISITNTDQDYYQTGIIELYNCSQQNVGDNIDIYINNSMEFSGYVARKQIHHKAGTSLYTYQLVGKTYDLWRYRTGKGVTYTGYSGYIASSLIHDFCTNIYGNSNITEGVEFENKIDLSDKTVGDALVTLIGYDGFKFYVDADNNLVYYDPDDDATSTILVEEDDIVDMSPIEEADEDLVNDVVVIGADNYYTTTEIPLPAGKAIADVSSGVFKTNMYIAQRVKAKEDTMSAVRMFLNRSTEPYEPENNVQFEVWDNTTQQLMNDSFDSQMVNWSVTSNTFFKDGSLQLVTLYNDIKQENSTSISGWPHLAQLFTPLTTSYVEGAYISCYHELGIAEKVWIEVRNIKSNTTNEPSGSNGILCSGSVNLGNLIELSDVVSLKPRTELTAGKKYAVVCHLDDITDPNYITAKLTLADSYGGTDYYRWRTTMPITDPPTWAGYTNQDLKFLVRMEGVGGYKTSGYAISKSFGSPTRKIFNRYMKVELDGVTSSQRVYISGSNSGSKHYHTLTDGLWYDFGTENIGGFSSQVKIWLSGNGTYTPKVGSVIVSVADSTSGPGETVFTDNFLNYTYLSSATKNGVFTDNGFLMMSGSKGYTYATRWISPTTAAETQGDYFEYDTDFASASLSNYAINVNYYGTSYYPLRFTFTLDNYYDISKFKTITGFTIYETDNIVSLHEIYLSGNWAGKGYIMAYSGNICISPTYRGTITTEIPFDNNCVYYNVKKIRISGNWKAKSQSTLTLSAAYTLQENYTTYSGSIQSKDYNIGNPIISLKLSPTTETYSNKITYSGSKNSGSTWYKLTKNTYTTLGAGGASGSHIKVMYNFKPSTLTTTNTNPHISTQNLKNSSPSIDTVVLEYATTTAGNLPKSGTKLERSSDIYIEPSDVPYPPSYSAWVSYTHPALRQNDGTHLDTDNYYWIIMHANSGATTALEHWNYYYDWNSDYTDGAIAYSTGNAAIGLGVGVNWKTWDTKPLWVPKGSLIMDIGWKGDEQIRATATNEQSINLFGRHQKIVNDSRVDSFALASSMANEMVAGMQTIPKKGWITIEGVEGIKTTYKLSSNLSNIGLGGLWEIVGYTQTIDKNGFTTNLQYGKPGFDITKRIADLEKRVY